MSVPPTLARQQGTEGKLPSPPKVRKPSEGKLREGETEHGDRKNGPLKQKVMAVSRLLRMYAPPSQHTLIRVFRAIMGKYSRLLRMSVLSLTTLVLMLVCLGRLVG